jgi:hypothetical protein
VPQPIREHQFARQDVSSGLLQVRRVDAPDLAALLARASHKTQPEPALSNEITNGRRQVCAIGGYPSPVERR